MRHDDIVIDKEQELKAAIDALEKTFEKTPAPEPVEIPAKALAALRNLQTLIEKHQGQMSGILIGVSSVIDIPQGAGIDLGTGYFTSG